MYGIGVDTFTEARKLIAAFKGTITVLAARTCKTCNRLPQGPPTQREESEELDFNAPNLAC